jgi:AAA+ ATPase superfamily predicted ATPase
MTQFKIGSPASPKDIINRKEEIASLLSKTKSAKINYNVAVIGHRRIGKTSILAKLYYMLSEQNTIVPVYFDVQKNMAEPKIFFTRLEKTIFDAYVKKLSGAQRTRTISSGILGGILAKIIDAVKTKKITGISAEITQEGAIIPKVDFGDKKPDYTEIFYSVFLTAKAFADKSNLKFVIILDEFQDITGLKRYEGLKEIFNLFRAAVQERGDNVSYVISGSRVHLLKGILDSGSSPLFTHFEKLEVRQLSRQHSIELFTKYQKARKVKPDEKAAQKAYDLVGGVPFYLMALAQACKAGDDIEETYHEILTSPLGSLKNYVDYVLSEDLGSVKGGPILRTILRALASSKDGLSYSEISRKINVAITKLPFYMNALVNSDLVERAEKRFIIRDKIVRDYLKIEAGELE